jgi:hypothetical protein
VTATADIQNLHLALHLARDLFHGPDSNHARRHQFVIAAAALAAPVATVVAIHPQIRSHLTTRMLLGTDPDLTRTGAVAVAGTGFGEDTMIATPEPELAMTGDIAAVAATRLQGADVARLHLLLPIPLPARHRVPSPLILPKMISNIVVVTTNDLRSLLPLLLARRSPRKTTGTTACVGQVLGTLIQMKMETVRGATAPKQRWVLDKVTVDDNHYFNMGVCASVDGRRQADRGYSPTLFYVYLRPKDQRIYATNIIHIRPAQWC